MTLPDAERAALLPPNHLVDAARPDGWAPIPTRTVHDALHLEKVLRALWQTDSTSWISANGRPYVVPGRYDRDTAVSIQDGGPGHWWCGCAQSHETEYLCYPVLQVAILRGDLIRRHVGPATTLQATATPLSAGGA